MKMMENAFLAIEMSLNRRLNVNNQPISLDWTYLNLPNQFSYFDPTHRWPTGVIFGQNLPEKCDIWTIKQVE